MELTRRDALAALGGAVAVGGSGAALTWRSLRRDDSDAERGDAPVSLSPPEVATLEATAEVIYPSAVSGLPSFLETYVVARARERPGRIAGMRDAISAVEERARAWHDAPFRDLPPDDRDAVLRQMGVDYRDPDPEGVTGERVRYYLVNELLYALYSTPTGAELVGLPNPQGYPGGTASYQRGPEDG